MPTLIVETGTGASNSNAYDSEANVESYITDYYPTDAWLSATSAQKQTSILKATRYLDMVYGRRIRGNAVKSDQALRFPRVGIYNDDGNLYGSDSVPLKVRQAVAEMALRAFSEDIIPDVDDDGAVSEEEIKVGPITTKTKYAGSKRAYKKYSIVDGLMMDFVYQPGQMGRA